ncbi:hypothetical protein QEH59_03670 [Coraliomargarita sp. SDUM461004]|uniref:Type 4 fimbrial biogenesis protein PilX N-terminal domain-containing protein n=2 Tax=Thalassobacterium sedimentorum TaxID=3041258 RepID=A0ABU1AIQ8_9BACT|nr:hypothetical protein [Coraliomargarita sp. SDUM461004]
MSEYKMHLTGKKQCGMQGFALVIALSLMSFILLLLLSLTTFIRVESEVSGQQLYQLKARQNAVLGAQIALADLQQALGPDQRINASAEILLPENTSSPRRFWVGAYQSWTASESSRPAPQLKRWLVSGSEDEVVRDDPSAVNFEHVTLDLVNASSDNQVEAGLVDVDAHNKYSWWISDENSKLGIETKITALGEFADWIAQSGGSAFPSLDFIEGLAGVDPFDVQINTVNTQRNIELIGADFVNHKEDLFHAVSPHSMGLLTNVRAGGLRRDFSFYLETSEGQRPIAPLYQHAGIDGINFSELWAYYNLWRQLGSGSGMSHPDGGSLPLGVPVLRGNADPETEASSPFSPYQRPIMIRAGWLISVKAEYSSDDDNYKVILVQDPIVTVWNPYDVTLEVPPESYMNIKAWGAPYNVNIYANGVLHDDRFISGSIGGHINLEIGVSGGDPLVMRPGEVLIYSQAGSAGADATDPVNDKNYPASFGWNRGSGGLQIVMNERVEAGDLIAVELEASNQQGAIGQGLVEFLEHVGSSSNGDAYAGGFLIDRKGWNADLSALDDPTLFPPIALRDIGKPEDLESTKQNIAFFSVAMRTEADSNRPSRFLSRVSRAAGGYDLQSFDADDIANQGIEIRMTGIDSNFSYPDFDILGGSGYYGGSYDSSAGNSTLITHSIPRAPIFSLAAFQHASASGIGSIHVLGPPAQFHVRKLEPVVNFAIGNSHSTPVIAPNASTGTTNDGMAAVDHSYWVNEALWDEWFFSSIAPQTASVFSVMRSQRKVFDDFLLNDVDLPNRHMRLNSSVDVVAATSALFAGDDPTSSAHTLSAQYLSIKGAFNVNSMNVDAWKGHLASLSDELIPRIDPASGAIAWDIPADIPMPGLSIPASGSIDVSELSDVSGSGQWLGYREVDDSMLQGLAESIVDEVRRRGPFLSMADFVNRRLSSDETLAKSGALQAALDATVNETLISDGNRSVALSDVPAGMPFRAAEVGARATGMPGYVDQADLLTVMGPSLAVRSDTFKIRTYGEVHDLAGNVVATARGEAIVQRSYDYIDESDSSELSQSELGSDVNRNFGRRFNIIAFRWLNDDDV